MHSLGKNLSISIVNSKFNGLGLLFLLFPLNADQRNTISVDLFFQIDKYINYIYEKLRRLANAVKWNRPDLHNDRLDLELAFCRNFKGGLSTPGLGEGPVEVG